MTLTKILFQYQHSEHLRTSIYFLTHQREKYRRKHLANFIGCFNQMCMDFVKPLFTFVIIVLHARSSNDQTLNCRDVKFVGMSIEFLKLKTLIIKCSSIWASQCNTLSFSIRKWCYNYSMNKIACLLEFDFIFLIYEQEYCKIIHSLLSMLARSI